MPYSIPNRCFACGSPRVRFCKGCESFVCDQHDNPDLWPGHKALDHLMVAGSYDPREDDELKLFDEAARREELK